MQEGPSYAVMILNSTGGSGTAAILRSHGEV